MTGSSIVGVGAAFKYRNAELRRGADLEHLLPVVVPDERIFTAGPQLLSVFAHRPKMLPHEVTVRLGSNQLSARDWGRSLTATRVCESRHYVTAGRAPLGEPALHPAILAEFWRDSPTPRVRNRPRVAARRHTGLQSQRMPRRTRVVTWNGKDIPPELLELPAGRYVAEPVEEEAPVLTPEEEAGIETALESYRQGRVVYAKRARQIIDAALGH